MKKKLYLANSYGFSRQTKNSLKEFIEIFENLGLEVYEPFTRTTKLANKGKDWAYNIAKSNVNDIYECDCIFAIVNGNPPDEGVMVEIGIGIALKKDIFLFRDDFRSCSDSDQYPLNLMVFASLPKDTWSRNYLESIDDITSNKKNFMHWAQSTK